MFLSTGDNIFKTHFLPLLLVVSPRHTLQRPAFHANILTAFFAVALFSGSVI